MPDLTDRDDLIERMCVAYVDAGGYEDGTNRLGVDSQALTTPRLEGRGFSASRPGVPASQPTARWSPTMSDVRSTGIALTGYGKTCRNVRTLAVRRTSAETPIRTPGSATPVLLRRGPIPPRPEGRGLLGGIR